MSIDDPEFWLILSIGAVVGLLTWFSIARKSYLNAQHIEAQEAKSERQEAKIDDLVEALRSGKTAVPIPTSDAVKNLSTLSNQDLKQKVGELGSQMRIFENNMKLQRYTDSNHDFSQGSEADRKAAWDESVELMLRRSDMNRAEFNRRYRPTALALRDEMRRRLCLLPPFDQRDVALDIGLLAGHSPVEESATNLESLARQLPD